MRNLLLLIFFIFSISLSTHAQDRFVKGYYVTPKNDTIHGLIRYRDTYLQEITFKADRKALSKNLGTEEVKSFAFENGQTYELVNFADKNAPSSPTYARKLGGDAMSLYHSHSQFLMGSYEKGFFVLKKGKVSNSAEAMSRLQKNTGAFNILFQDCAEVKNNAIKSGIDDEVLLETLKQYHECKGQPFKSYTPVRRRKFHFGVFVGASISEISFSGEEHLAGTTFNKSTKPQFGVLMRFTPTKKASSIFSMQLEFLYTSVAFQGTYADERDVSGYHIKVNSTTSLESQIIMPRFGFQLTGRSNFLNPYVTFGIGLPGIVTSKSYDYKTVAINSSSETTEEYDTMEVGVASVWAGAGLKKNFGKNSSLFADVIFSLVAGDGTVSMIAPRVGFTF